MDFPSIKVRFKSATELMKGSKSLYNESRELYQYIKEISRLSSIKLEELKLGSRNDNELAETLRDATRNQTITNIKIKSQVRSYSGDAYESAYKKNFNDIRQVGGWFKAFRAVPVVAGAFMVAHTVISVATKLANFYKNLIMGFARRFQSYALRGIQEASLAQTDFISQVNTLATLQGKSYAQAEQETLKNNKEFRDVVKNLPGNVGTYTQIYQQGLDEQLSIFGTTENALKNVRERQAESFTVLIGKIAAQSGMAPEMVVRDLAQLRNQGGNRGIGILYSDRILMQKFEENRERSVASLMDVLSLDSSNAKAASQMSAGDKRVLDLYAALYETQNPDKDKASANTMSAITGRLNSALWDVNMGMFGFARMLKNETNIIKRATDIVGGFWNTIAPAFTTILGSAIDPLEWLGKWINKLHYQVIQFNRYFDTFLTFNSQAFGIPDVTSIASATGRMMADSVNILAEFTNTLFTGSAWRDAVGDPDSVLGSLSKAFMDTLDVDAVSYAANSVTGILTKLTRLILSSASYVWSTMTQYSVEGLKNKGHVNTNSVSQTSEVASANAKGHGHKLNPMLMGAGANAYSGLMPARNRDVTEEAALIPTNDPLKSFYYINSEAQDAVKNTGLFTDLKTTNTQFIVAKVETEKLYKERKNIFEKFRGLIGLLAKSPKQQDSYLDVMPGKLPPVEGRSQALGNVLSVKFGKLLQKRGFYLHQHRFFDAERGQTYRLRGTNTYHDRGSAIDILLPGGAATMYDDQIPILEAVQNIVKQTGMVPKELFHGSTKWASRGGMGVLDIPGRPTVGGIHHHHVHLAMYEGNLKPLELELQNVSQPKPKYNVKVIKTDTETVMCWVDKRVTGEINQRRMVAI